MKIIAAKQSPSVKIDSINVGDCFSILMPGESRRRVLIKTSGGATDLSDGSFYGTFSCGLSTGSDVRVHPNAEVRLMD